MLRRYQAQLDTTNDFGTLVLPVDGGQTMMRPPIVSAAQMAFALGDNAQVARETSWHLRNHTRGAAGFHTSELAELPRAELG